MKRILQPGGHLDDLLGLHEFEKLDPEQKERYIFSRFQAHGLGGYFIVYRGWTKSELSEDGETTKWDVYLGKLFGAYRVLLNRYRYLKYAKGRVKVDASDMLLCERELFRLTPHGVINAKNVSGHVYDMVYEQKRRGGMLLTY